MDARVRINCSACSMFSTMLRNAWIGLACWMSPLLADSFVALDENDPFYVDHTFPKLTTPQWVGDSSTEAVVVLAIDDMREPEKYESYLRPILNRLKKIDGKGHVSIMSNAIDPSQPRYQTWLNEGVSLEVHTLTHPCPLLSKGSFDAAADTYFGGIDLLNHVPGNRPVAYRMPCCDSINSPSPRFYAELFNRTNPAGQFLQIDSSVMCAYTSVDPDLPREWVKNEKGEERFARYMPFDSFVTTIENYPYPYIIGRKCWEFPCMVPSDWEAQNVQGVNHEDTVRDWKRALDLTVLKQGVFNLVFHPHGWIRSEQVVELIDYAKGRYGDRVAFLNFDECLSRLNEHLLRGQSLRDVEGEDNGVRLIDLNSDGFLDVVIGNSKLRLTRVWNSASNEWDESPFPTELVGEAGLDSGVKFARVTINGASAIVRADDFEGAWRLVGNQWQEDPALVRELRVSRRPIYSILRKMDTGLRVRDLDRDGLHEVILGSDGEGQVLKWDNTNRTWQSEDYSLPDGMTMVDERGRDNGVRFVDVNGDGYDDLLQSNEERYSLHLYIPEIVLGFARGWSRTVTDRRRTGQLGEIPPFVREGEYRHNGAWFHSGHLWVQNEETAHLPDLVDRRSFDSLLAGDIPVPVDPQKAIELMQYDSELRVELVAAEPLIADPVYFDWGPDGTLWVVEMGDYPAGTDGQGQSGGRVRRLTDQDGDGFYEQSIVFLEGLNFPTGLIPWSKGVLVSAAPDIFYAEDQDGDGRADLRELWFTGFVEGNQQHRVNGFARGLDGWLYGANGDSGGKISRPGQGESVNISGRDFRFHPVTKAFEAIEGRTQFGRHRDDWGNWFGNNNPNWLWHYWFPEEYLENNPNFALPTNKRYLGRDDPFVYSIGTALQRFNDVGHRNHVTSGNSPTPYRDNLFDGDYRQSVFVSEPVHNVIHREVLTRDGVSFVSQRAASERDREFLASTDPWFRPTGMKTGPDGALYFADMYRLVIEHPEWIPDDVAAVMDLRSGDDRGRIYRIYPDGKARRKIPNLAAESSADWVERLRSESGWVRDTAQALLVADANSGERSDVVESVRNLLKSESVSSKTQLQALWTLQELGRLSPGDVLLGLNSSSEEVRRNAVQLSEPFADRGLTRPSNSPVEPGVFELASKLLSLVRDPSESVRFQLALSIGNIPYGYWDALFQLAATARSAELMQAFEVSLPHKLAGIVRSATREPELFFEKEDLHAIILRYGLLQRDAVRVRALLEWVLSDFTIAQTEPGLDFLRRYFLELKKEGLRDDPDFDASLGHYQSREVSASLQSLFDHAESVVQNGAKPVSIRAVAFGFLYEVEPRLELLRGVLSGKESAALQQDVLQLLRGHSTPRFRAELRRAWPVLRAPVRSLVVRQWFNTPNKLADIVDELVAGHWQGMLAMGEIRGALARLNDSRLRDLMEAPKRDRGEAFPFDRMLEAVFEVSGDEARGKALFGTYCASCHRLGNDGFEVGPDLRSVSDRSTGGWLLAIMEPNRAVEAKFQAYSVETEAGDAFTGVVGEETGSSLTLLLPNSDPLILRRNEIAEIRGSDLSLMPEGLAEQLGPRGLADLIAFLQTQ